MKQYFLLLSLTLFILHHLLLPLTLILLLFFPLLLPIPQHLFPLLYHLTLHLVLIILLPPFLLRTHIPCRLDRKPIPDVSNIFLTTMSILLLPVHQILSQPTTPKLSNMIIGAKLWLRNSMHWPKIIRGT
jgi:hypothetical protein